MPGLSKHVHFGGNASPAPSSSSLPSSAGPATPPHGFIPYYSAPASTTDVNGFVNPILSPNNTRFELDLSQHPTSMKNYASIPPSVWQQPTTNPPCPSMIVMCDRLPWAITILPSSGQHGYVTVGDFVYGLFNGLSQMVSEPEFSTLPPAGQEAVTKAYRRRCKWSLDGQYDEELMRGVKRVDFLVGSTRYSGIKGGKAGRWTMMVRSND